MKKLLALCLCLLWIAPCAVAEERYAAIPALLQFSQKEAPREKVQGDNYILRTYPITANAQVNAQLRALIDEMTERGRPVLNGATSELMPAYLDVGANIFRTGTQWMSLLTIARSACEREQVYVDFDARVYDMATGDRLTLTDLFPADSPAWALLMQETADQLSAYFPAEIPDAAVLSALCTREALENAAFTLTPAKLSLHFRADALYPGHQTLMHVNVYYPAIRAYMTEAARQQTDNSRYKLIALTYDDGPARSYSMNLMHELRRYGASATFFVVGTNIAKNHDVLCREHDAGHDVASHNYVHTYDDLTQDNILTWKSKFNAAILPIIGVSPATMRAPGGHFKQFIAAQAGLPLIQWSVISGDAGSKDAGKISSRVIGSAKDGAVVLMHDINNKVSQYSASILPALEKKGFLCVTVEELFSHYGVTLEGDQVYYDCTEEAKLR